MNIDEISASIHRKARAFKWDTHSQFRPGIPNCTHVIFPELHFTKFYEWCESRFGDNWVWTTFASESHFWFMYAEDALMFKLNFAGSTSLVE